MFRDGSVEGVLLKPLGKFVDDRGWLVEIFRTDELEARYAPVMTYISETLPGVARGPHEHREQVDTFGFIGPSTFEVYLWDNRESSSTYRNRTRVRAGVDQPMAITIPAGVVHAYKNVGDVPGWVLNCPNRLYRGEGKAEPVDEIRHENEPDSPYVLF